MIAIYRDTRGRPLTIHRTYVDKNGDKAPVENPKLMMKPPADMTGGSIQLFDHYDSGSSTRHWEWLKDRERAFCCRSDFNTMLGSQLRMVP